MLSWHTKFSRVLYLCSLVKSSMYNLLIDVGNSSVKIACSMGNVLEKVVRVDNEDIIGRIRSLSEEYPIDIAVISSVRECDGVYGFVEGISRKTILLNGLTDLPVKINYATPHTLGPDRIAAAVAVNTMFPGERSLVFDFGTAITIDIISEKGEFLGGNISPGIDMRFRALNAYTGKLPLCEKPLKFNNIGLSTKEAIESGVVLGIMFEVEGYLQKYQDYKAVFTGGNSLYFADELKNPIFVVFNLVLIGLAYIADYHANN